MESKRTMIKIFIVILVLLALALFLNWSNKSLLTTGYAYIDEDIPEAFNGYRITQLSDLQSEYFGEKQSNLLTKVRESEPDIIVFTGDLIDRNHTDYEAALIAMRGLVEIAPVYYVNGNHEMALPETKMSEIYDELEKMGVHVLIDREEVVEKDGQKIHLLGFSEYTMYECKAFGKFNGEKVDTDVLKWEVNQLTETVGEEEFVIMLTHEPQFLETYASKKIDLIFAGHAHGGQIRLPFTEGLFAPGQGIMPKLTNGMHVLGDTTMIISRGLGNSTFPFRVFNRPEIVMVDLKKS